MRAEAHDAGIPRIERVASRKSTSEDGSRPVDATPRRWWVLVYLVTVAAVVVTAPTLRSEVDRQLAGSDAVGQVHDPALADLAINIGMLLAVLLFMLVLALYLSLASVMDRSLFRPRLRPNGRGPIGLFFIVAACCTVPVHAVSAAFSIAGPKDTPLFYVYVMAVGIAAPFLFRRYWVDLERSRKAALFGSALMLAAASYVA
jgi:hypothetical protein